MSKVFNDDVNFNNYVNFFDTVNIFGKLEVVRDVTISGKSDIIGNLSVFGDSIIGGNVTANSFVTQNGTSNGFLKADGSVDTTTYITAGTVGGTPENVGGQIVLRNGIGGFSAGIVTTTSVTTTSLIVNGNARVAGILTVGSSSVTINGSTNVISGVSTITDSGGGILSVPPGAIQFFARNSAPNGWLKANGATISRSAYASLFNSIGVTFGAGDGSTTFILPDLRGEFPRCWDDGRGIDSGRVFGSAQTDAMQGHKHRLPSAYTDSSFALYGGKAGADGTTFYHSDGVGTAYQHFTSTPTDSDGTNGTPRIATETRSRNIALLACIKY